MRGGASCQRRRRGSGLETVPSGGLQQAGASPCADPPRCIVARPRPGSEAPSCLRRAVGLSLWEKPPPPPHQAWAGHVRISSPSAFYY